MIIEKVGRRAVTTAQAARFLKLSVRTLEDWRLKKFGPTFLRMQGGKKNREEVYYWADDIRRFKKVYTPKGSKRKNSG